MNNEAAAMQRVTVKDHWVQVTGEEAVALRSTIGKWRDNLPTTVLRDGVLYALVDEALKVWRAERVSSGKTRC